MSTYTAAEVRELRRRAERAEAELERMRARLEKRRVRRRSERKDAQEVAAFLVRMMRAYARRALAGETEPADLADLFTIRVELERVVDATVVAARRTGFSWSEIASSTGTTKQTAHERWAGKVREADKGVRAALTDDERTETA